VRSGPGPMTYGNPSVHPDGRLLAVGMNQGVGFWDLITGDELGFLPTGAPHTQVLFEPSGDLITQNPGVFRWPVRSDPGDPSRIRVGPPRQLPLAGNGNIYSVSRDGHVLTQGQRAA